MARVSGIQERIHWVLYDSIRVDPEKQLKEVLSGSNALRFFVDVTGKNKLETNLQSASLLPHYNTFEARALRVVIAEAKAQFPEGTRTDFTDLPVTDSQGNIIVKRTSGTSITFVAITTSTPRQTGDVDVVADLSLGLDRLVELIIEARDSDDDEAVVAVSKDDEDLTVRAGTNELTQDQIDQLETMGAVVPISLDDLEGALDDLAEEERPLEIQVDGDNGIDNLISRIIYNTVTTLFVGEKILITAPTYCFPAGAGIHSESTRVVAHGEPTPLATFRFGEAVKISPQQPFRVEIEVPVDEVLRDLRRVYGPFQMWVILDGYMTRDVQ